MNNQSLLDTSSPVMWTIIIAYVVFNIVLGAFISYRKKSGDNTTSFLISNRNMPSFVIALVAVSTSISGVAYIGTNAYIFAFGIAMWIGGPILGGNIGHLTGPYVVGRPIRSVAQKLNALTFNEFLEKMYKTRKFRYPTAICLLVGGIALTTTEFTTLGTLLHALVGINFGVAILICAIVVAVVVAIGGNTTNGFVSVYQMAVAIAAALCLAAYGLHQGGGMINLFENVAKIDMDHVLPHGAAGFGGIGAVVGFGLTYCVGMWGAPHVVDKYATIRSKSLTPSLASLGNISHVVVCLLYFSGFAYFVAAAKGVVPGITPETFENVTPYFISAYCGPIVAGLLVAGIIAAGITTLASLLLTLSGCVVNDVLHGIFKVNTGGKRGVNFTRVALLVILVVSAFLGANPPSTIMAMAAAAFALYAATFTPTIVFGLRWRRSNVPAALVSMWFGLIGRAGIMVAVGLFPNWVWPLPIDANGTMIIASFVVYAIVALCTKPVDKSHYMPEKISELKPRTTPTAIVEGIHVHGALLDEWNAAKTKEEKKAVKAKVVAQEQQRMLENMLASHSD